MEEEKLTNITEIQSQKRTQLHTKIGQPRRND